MKTPQEILSLRTQKLTLKSVPQASQPGVQWHHCLACEESVLPLHPEQLTKDEEQPNVQTFECPNCQTHLKLIDETRIELVDQANLKMKIKPKV